jgi:thioredoxin 1
VDELAVEFDGRAKVVKLNTGENFDSAVAYGVRMLPTILFFKDGQPVQQIVGFKDKAQLAAVLESVITG